MSRDIPTHISLTGEKSHKISVPAGQGSFSIGTIGLSEGKYDVWVDDDKPINWSAFDGFYTGHGKANAEQHPYGDWPRWFYYSGSDKGFIEWSCKRHIGVLLSMTVFSTGKAHQERDNIGLGGLC